MLHEMWIFISIILQCFIGKKWSASANAANPVISVNGNTAALCGKEMVSLAKAFGAKLEVNIFYSGMDRRKKIANTLLRYGAKNVLGADATNSVRLPGISSARSMVDKRGIAASDLVLVALEDGDRTSALKAAGKTIIAIDLNPLSRTAQDADITIVDNLTRSTRMLAIQYKLLSGRSKPALKKILDGFDNNACLASGITRAMSGLKKRARNFA